MNVGLSAAAVFGRQGGFLSIPLAVRSLSWTATVREIDWRLGEDVSLENGFERMEARIS